jgi:two-component system sensor histidine kinase DesK
MATVRETVAGSRQPTLEAELAAARTALAAADIAPTIEASGEELPPVVDAVLAWTVREGITNVVRHSDARRVRIRIDRTGDWAEASITDDGRGEGRPANVVDGAGSGLTGLAERVAALGGRFDAGPMSGGGFRVDVRLPLEPSST